MGSVQWLKEWNQKKKTELRERETQTQSSGVKRVQLLISHPRASKLCADVCEGKQASEAELRSEISWGIVWSSETSRSFAMWWDERAIPRRCHQNINLCDCLPQKGTNEKASGQKVRRIHRLHKSTESDDVWLISHFLLSLLFVTAVNERIGFDTMVIHQHQIACQCLNEALLKCDFYYLI